MVSKIVPWTAARPNSAHSSSAAPAARLPLKTTNICTCFILIIFIFNLILWQIFFMGFDLGNNFLLLFMNFYGFSAFRSNDLRFF